MTFNLTPTLSQSGRLIALCCTSSGWCSNPFSPVVPPRCICWPLGSPTAHTPPLISVFLLEEIRNKCGVSLPHLKVSRRNWNGVPILFSCHKHYTVTASFCCPGLLQQTSVLQQSLAEKQTLGSTFVHTYLVRLMSNSLGTLLWWSRSSEGISRGSFRFYKSASLKQRRGDDTWTWWRWIILVFQCIWNYRPRNVVLSINLFTKEVTW